MFDRESLFDSIYNLSAAELKILKTYIDEYMKKKFITKFVSSANVFIFFVKKFDDNLCLCVRRLSWLEWNNHQKSIFVVFDKWKFKQIVRSKNLFEVKRQKRFSSHSHTKWRRMKNDVQMSIRSLSISNNVLWINKFIDYVSDLYQSNHAFLFKRFRIDLYKRHTDLLAVDERARWACQVNAETTEKMQSLCQVQ